MIKPPQEKTTPNNGGREGGGGGEPCQKGNSVPDYPLGTYIVIIG